MSGDAVRRQQSDEDTAVGFLGHMTHQANEGPEQVPDDRNRQQRGPERNPSQPDKQDQHKDKKRNRGNRK
jgi:hypothetical protein